MLEIRSAGRTRQLPRPVSVLDPLLDRLERESLVTPPIHPAAPEPAKGHYTSAEVAADRLVHLSGLTLGATGVAWMLVTVLPMGTDLQRTAAGVYAFGLIVMLCASAGYNLTRTGPLKAWLRRIDHAAIFVLIAGTYTPFSLLALAPEIGVPLCGIVWVLAFSGGALKLRDTHRRERAFLVLYLIMGWALLPVFPSFIVSLPSDVLALLLTGGAVYTLGALIHSYGSWRFHNAIWHAMVLAASSMHFAAVMRLFACCAVR